MALVVDTASGIYFILEIPAKCLFIKRRNHNIYLGLLNKIEPTVLIKAS